MLLDASASMNARTAGRSALDRARTAALAVAGRLGKDDRLTLIRVGAQPTEVFGRFSADVETTREKVEAVQSGPARANLFTAFSRVLGQARRDRPPAVYLFSDGQSSSWREVREQGLDRVIPQGTRITVVDVGSDVTLANRGVIGDAPRRELAVVGLPVRLRPRVVNHAPNEPADLTVGVFLDEKEVARFRSRCGPASLPRRRSSTRPTEAGVIRGRFEIAADRFPDDDSLPLRSARCASAQGAAGQRLPSRRSVRERGALYPHRAGRHGGRRPRPGRCAAGGEIARSRSRVRAVARRPRDLRRPAQPKSLREAGVVILLNCGEIGKEQYQVLREFVRPGAGCLIFPGDKVNAESYSRQFFPVPGQPGETLTAAILGSPAGRPREA